MHGLRLTELGSEEKARLNREEIAKLALAEKDRLGLTWPQVGDAIGRSPVYAAMLVYGYGQATTDEAEALARTLSLPEEAKAALAVSTAPGRRACNRNGRRPTRSSIAFTRSSCFTARSSKTWPTNSSATAS